MDVNLSEEGRRALNRATLRISVAEIVRQMPFTAEDFRAGVEDGLAASQIDQDAE